MTTTGEDELKIHIHQSCNFTKFLLQNWIEKKKIILNSFMYATIISYSQSYLQFPKISPPSWVAVSRRLSAKDVPSSITMKSQKNLTPKNIPSKNWKISSAMVVVGWLTTRKIVSKFNPYLKKSNDSIFFKSNFLRLHALPDTDKLILRLNDELLSHVHQMSAIKRFFYSTWIEWIIA